MDELYKKQLEKNIIKYTWSKAFTKRVFLPLIAIQLVSVGKVTIEQIALISILTSAFTFALQLPTGYIADKYGNRFAIITGASIASFSPLFYIFMPNFMGGLIASLFYFGGFTFVSGAIEAFMHDTLIALGREKEYSKVMGRAQSYGLIGNVVLISLVPATYAINPNLPFVLGFVSLLVALWLAISFTYPTNHSDQKSKDPFDAVTSIVSWQNVALFIFAGFMAGISNKAYEYRELLFQDIGIAVSVFGLLLSLASIVGAVLGRYIHVIDRLKPLSFYFFDLVLMTGCLVLIGATKNQWIAVAGFTLFIGYTRVRQIVFQSKVLEEVKHAYKATLISALNLFNVVGDISAIALLAKAIGLYGYSSGYFLFGFVAFGVGLVLWLLMLVEHRYRMVKAV
jgi:MFS family permease